MESIEENNPQEKNQIFIFKNMTSIMEEYEKKNNKMKGY